MTGERFVVLGLAQVRAPWFGEVGRWATAASVPVDFIRCVSAEELRARLAGGRQFSAVLIDSAIPDLDRDLIDTATAAGAATIIVDDGLRSRAWPSLGATAMLPSAFDRDDLMEILAQHGKAIERRESIRSSHPPEPAPGWTGRLVAVTGASGMGTSVAAMALAQGIGADSRYRDLTLLADFALDADQAMLHDARDIMPGLQELVEAHRSGAPDVPQVRSLVFDVDGRGHHLLLGLRRHRDWSVLRPRAMASALDTLLRSYRVVVADLEADLEGEDEVGSIDVEERNMLSRTTVGRADLVVAVGAGSLKGLHALTRVVGDLLAFGVPPERIVPVLNRSARSVRQRAEATRAFGELVAPLSRSLPTPIHVPDRRQVDDLLRDGAPLPTQITKPLAAAVLALLERAQPVGAAVGIDPVPLALGSLGHFADAGLHADLDEEAS